MSMNFDEVDKVGLPREKNGAHEKILDFRRSISDEVTSLPMFECNPNNGNAPLAF
ncbi:hypothetical protein KXD93_14300 [Mucilaginibacter sp. BJC16-A38]|uniref:hypothetical protein n=1 Tax=Mucilaginibacter phenanthrenivorans TaxID=1234842 RepID=UPI0021586BC4|nr:hypothetical protein [Mucilaginibacter phenanthrenivorans]MCR8558825.1 hypothetical protein [Mucilaginibacter phenanthrenivorans]